MNENGYKKDWVEDHAEEEDGLQVGEYEITVSPNDFNVMTLHHFVESGSVSIPGFQRNFVWDLKRASKLIESLILGLPIPQLFLYEQERNKFLVIDGQQRLMSIYYFIKGRFPRTESRAELRSIFEAKSRIPEEVLHDDSYFQNFNLRLSEELPNHANKFNGLNYKTLDDYKTQFDLRPIRNIVVKQNSPSDDSSIYEIFNRLNSGGVNLMPQELRTSMYHSEFYNLLYRLNNMERWRKFLGNPEPDLHMKDIEILLRGFALLVDSQNYAPSMAKFLNQFSKKCKTQSPERNKYLRKLFEAFLEACSDLPENAFKNKKNNRFNVALYEAVFTAACEQAFSRKNLVIGALDTAQMHTLQTDKEFIEASLVGTTLAPNVRKRLNRARKIMGALAVGSND